MTDYYTIGSIAEILQRRNKPKGRILSESMKAPVHEDGNGTTDKSMNGSEEKPNVRKGSKRPLESPMEMKIQEGYVESQGKPQKKKKKMSSQSTPDQDDSSSKLSPDYVPIWKTSLNDERVPKSLRKKDIYVAEKSSQDTLQEENDPAEMEELVPSLKKTRQKFSGSPTKSGENSLDLEDEKINPSDSMEEDVTEPPTDQFQKQKRRNTVFVGNLPKNVKKKKIIKFFSKYGKVNTVRLRSAPVSDPRIPKKVSAITKKFHESRTSINAYVSFHDKASASKALAGNGALFSESHHIRVDLADESSHHSPSKAVFLGNVPFGAEEEQVRAVFSECGEINSVRLVRDHRTGIGKGFGYVNFETKEAVELALELDGVAELDKKVLRVQRCHQGGSKGKQPEKSPKKKKDHKRPKPSNKAYCVPAFQGQVAVEKTKQKKKGKKTSTKQNKMKKIFEMHDK